MPEREVMFKYRDEAEGNADSRLAPQRPGHFAGMSFRLDEYEDSEHCIKRLENS